MATIEELMKENQELLKRNKKLSDLFDYQENKYTKLLLMAQSGAREEIRGNIKLELEAIRECCKYISEADAFRIIKRLDRIDERLSEDYVL